MLLQVNVFRYYIQLPLQNYFPWHQSRRQPNRLHARFQQLLLRHAVPAFRRRLCQCMGEDQEDRAG